MLDDFAIRNKTEEASHGLLSYVSNGRTHPGKGYVLPFLSLRRKAKHNILHGHRLHQLRAEEAARLGLEVQGI